MTAPPVVCDRCDQPVDLAAPHITVLRQFEIEYEPGVVTVLDSPIQESQRHPGCQTEETHP